MTNEERRAYLKKWNEKKKAKERKALLEEVRNKITNLTFLCCEVSPASVIDEVVKIIDKYIESEEDKTIWQDSNF